MFDVARWRPKTELPTPVGTRAPRLSKYLILQDVFDLSRSFLRRLAGQLGLSDVVTETEAAKKKEEEKQKAALPAKSKVHAALAACRQAFLGLALFSALSNVLVLTGSFYMLQVYDRVLPSRSVPTLIGLSIAALVLFAFQGALDLIRSRINVRVGVFLDQSLNRNVYDSLVRMPLKTRGDGDGLQPLRDLDQIRGFLSGGGPSAFFDLPWMLFYLGICFVFHFWIGMTALFGILVLVCLALLTEFKTREPTKLASGFAMSRSALATSGRRNAEVMRAMGMTARVGALWREANSRYLAANQASSDVTNGLGNLSRIFRMILQSAVLGVGAYLVIHQESTAGVIIASSILTARALAPVEIAIANWKGFIAARQSAARLHHLLTILPEEHQPMALPTPKAMLVVDNVSAVPPGDQRIVIADISFALKSGQGLGIIGPSGSGKSSLARTLVGVWQPVRGKVKLDNAPLEQWHFEALGRHIGYLPQDVELFDGTIVQNIARFDEKPDPNTVIEAAKAAGVHALIMALPGGYEARIGEFGTVLSAGQRQRIALARALYGNPFLVVLDEPSSNLDAEGEEALTRAILHVRSRGGIPIVIAHRASALAGVDHVMIMRDGRVQSIGNKEDVLGTVMRRPPPAQPLKVVAEAQGGAR